MKNNFNKINSKDLFRSSCSETNSEEPLIPIKEYMIKGYNI